VGVGVSLCRTHLLVQQQPTTGAWIVPAGVSQTEARTEISERQKTLGNPCALPKNKIEKSSPKSVAKSTGQKTWSDATLQPRVSCSQNSLIALPADGVSHTIACHRSNQAVTVGLVTLSSVQTDQKRENYKELYESCGCVPKRHDTPCVALRPQL